MQIIYNKGKNAATNKVPVDQRSVQKIIITPCTIIQSDHYFHLKNIGTTHSYTYVYILQYDIAVYSKVLTCVL